jgi:hypothetical protein
MKQEATVWNYGIFYFPSQPDALAFKFNTEQVGKSQFILKICLYKARSFTAQKCVKKVKLSLCLIKHYVMKKT